ncbi:SbcC-like subunit of palindrome specific endonuclease [Enterobacteria phage vB_EcoM_IME341]|uniref:Recombination endonuclease subunit n=1 Tax=Enterobacteria phage vB_EcoM_IME341 TaxID=2163891 RepID=A0A2S1GS13_9CAUD|nr:SbcC-like subunit of palindrome specific endonuclease [Enterobacteria phage vB_EcoM_IME341]AWD92149.1 recombination endonuclease subunit [Enterobacteria phage vB_EcoM_IME341]
MKTFKLKKVTYKNIMSVGQQPITIQLDKVQKTLVTGKNGAGKSTFLEAVTFALFGKPFRDVKKGQLINSSNKKDLLVELWMEYDGKEYYIKRGQKPNIFEISCGGERLDESASSKDFQAEFEQLIGMSYASFKQIVVLGTAGYTPFMGLSTPARRKLVEDLLEVSVLADMDKLNKSLIRETNSQIQVIDVKQDSITQQIKIYNDNEERQRKLSGENAARLQTMYDELVKEARTAKGNIEKLTDELLNVIVDDDPSNSMSDLSNKGFAIKNDMATFTKVVKLYETGGSCPTCMQGLEEHGNILTKIKDKNFELQKSLDKINEQYQELKLIKDQVTEQRNKALAIKSQIATHKQQAITAVEKAKKVKVLIDQAAAEFVSNAEEIATLQAELDKIVSTKSSLVMEKYHRGILTEMLKDTGIKGSIIKKYIPIFNKQINSYLKIMEADYVFTLDEEFNETIKSRGREDFSYASFSQGEKARIDIALLFTWRDIASKVSGVNISTLILDEVFDSATDAEGVKTIATILNSLEDTNVFIISHRDHDPQAYGQHLQMKKVGRFTVME